MRIRRTSVGRNVDAQDPLRVAQSRSTIGSRSRRSRPTSTTPAAKFAAGQFENQLAAAAAGPIDPFGIDAALEAIRRSAVQVQLAGGGANRKRGELGGLDQQVGGRVGDFRCRRRPSRRRAPPRRLASAITHIPGRARRSCGRSPRTASPGSRLADDDLAAAAAWQVEGVQRLAAFHQHVVGDVDHVVDRGRCRASSAAGPASWGWGRSSRRESRGPCSGSRDRGSRSRTLTSSVDGRWPSGGCGGGNRQRHVRTARRFRGRCRYAPGSRAGCWSPPDRWPGRRRPPRVPSWFSPAIISRRSSSAGDMSSGTYSFSQFQETIMAMSSAGPSDTEHGLSGCDQPFKTGARNRTSFL